MAARIREPVDPSHIPSKLQKAEPANGVARRTTQSKRQIRANSQFQSTYDHQLEYPPAAPEVPRGPPISYRQQYGGDTIDQPRARSFSQRAKGQMLAPEALEDNEYWDDNDDIPAPVRISEDLRRSTDRTHARASVQNGLNIPKREARKDPSHRQTDMPPLGNPESTPKVHRRSGRGLKHSAEVEPLKLDLSSPPLSSSGSVSRRVSEGQGRDWADNRSPLQTLEVKLNDISKEEKRARVEEAEMLLRESKAVHGARQASREGTATSKRNGYTREGSLDAGNIESRELDCKTNGVRLDKTQHKSDVEPQKPVQRLPSGQSERADVHQEQSFAARSGAEQKKLSRDQVRSQQQASRTSDHTPSTGGEYRPLNLEKHQRESHASADITPIEPSSGHHLFEATEFDQGRPALRTEQRGKPQNEMKRAISTRQASAPQSIPSNITRAVSLQQHQPQPFFPEDQDISKSGPMRETNSSHKAALAEATATVSTSGATAATSIKHDNSRKLQKAPPGNLNRGSSSELETPKSIDDGVAQFGGSAVTPRFEIETVVQDPKVEFYYRGGMPKQVDVQRPNSQRVSEPAGPGLKEPAVAESPTATNRPRQTSVSFKVPFDKARPVNEWKQAGVARLTLADLALDLPSEHDKPWWESNGTSGRSRSKRSSGNAQTFDAFSQLEDTKSVEFKPPLYLKCGPLLRYTGMRRDRVAPQPGQTDKPMEREVWRGSVMIVTHDSQSSYEEVPTLRLFSQPRDLLPPPPEQVQGDDLAPEYIDPIAGLTKVSRRGQTLYVKPVDRVEESIDLSRVETDDGLFETSPSPIENTSHGSATPNKRTRGRDGESLGKYKEVKGVRLYADIERDVTFWRFNIEVELGSQQAHIAYRINRGPPVGFWVPAKSQTMNIMFHSCNGFSLSVNPDKFSGPDPLWRDVLNTHQTRPFHVMIGGGDQIYNDRVMVDTTHFAAWTHLRIPHEKHHAPFTDDMREELESFYLNRYAMWFSQGLFGLANSQIPMVNIYDDHDIIDGFGSYPDHFQKAPVFMGIGNIAFKYYMLFQHQSVPEETQVDEPSWLLGAKPGPYIQQLSRSVFLNLGQSVAFLGLDCRTERQVSG